MTEFPIGARVIVHPDSSKPIPGRIIPFEEYQKSRPLSDPKDSCVCVRADDPTSVVGWYEGLNAWAPEYTSRIQVLHDVCAECEGVCEPDDYLCAVCREV